MVDQPVPPAFYPDWRQHFRRDLRAAGFRPAAAEGPIENWIGTLEVCWEDPETGEYCSAAHQVCVRLPSAFPFDRPRVLPLDEQPPIHNSRHQAPDDDNGALCLWPPDSAGWLPWMGADELLARIRAWFVHYHQDDWGPEDRPPDLHLYFRVRQPRTLMLIGDDWQPPLDTRTGRFGVWYKEKGRAYFAGMPTRGVEMPALKHADRILGRLGLAGENRVRVGVWFRLLREPQPCTRLNELLADIDAATGQRPGWAMDQLLGVHGVKASGAGAIAIIALGCRAGPGQETWLFLQAHLSAGAARSKWTQPGNLSSIEVASLETAPAGSDAMMRRVGPVAKALQDRQVVVFGQGAIGGSVALLLAKSGIPRLRLVDSDHLRPTNVVRHVAGLGSSGYLKTHAVAVEVRDHAPDCQVQTAAAIWNPGVLREWIRSADVVVDATAHPAFSLLLNEICVQEERPAVYVAAHRRAAIGRIRIVRPRRNDACLACYESGYVGTATYPMIRPGEEGAFLEAGCGIPTVEAAAVDIEAAANGAASAVLRLLQDKLPGNHCLIVNDSLPDLDGVLQEIGVHWSTWPSRADCETCGGAKESEP